LPPLASTVPLPPPFHPHTATLTWTAGPGVSPEEGRVPPLLEQLFQRYPDQPMNIDLKESTPELVEATAKLIEEYNRESITIWGSSKDEMAMRSVTAHEITTELTTNPLTASIASHVLISFLRFYSHLLCRMYKRNPNVPLVSLSCAPLALKLMQLFTCFSLAHHSRPSFRSLVVRSSSPRGRLVCST
jgi:hypothetical protein